jgi:RNA polymerase sigma-70 factor (sigma-E family)
VADEAFADFVQTHGADLLRVAYLLCRDGARAEDLVQDALIKMLRRWRSVGGADHPNAYARRVIVNEYLGWRRLRASDELVTDAIDLPASDQFDSIVERDAVWRLIGALAPRARAVLVLRYYERLTDREIANLLGCAEPTVRSIAARAFTALRSHPALATVPEEA